MIVFKLTLKYTGITFEKETGEKMTLNSHYQVMI